MVTEEVEQSCEFWDEKKYLTEIDEEKWKILNPQIYTIFWYLNLQSLLVPDDTYAD